MITKNNALINYYRFLCSEIPRTIFDYQIKQLFGKTSDNDTKR